jgi:quercetin dioxygenase-like cupin family protein
VFALATLDRELREEDAYRCDGHAARVLVREADLRVVLIVLDAGARIPEHRAQATTTILALTGHVKLRLPDRLVDLTAGQLLVLDQALPHDLEADGESAVLLTLAPKARTPG